MSNKTRYIIIGICSAGMIVGLVMFLRTFSQYKKAEDEYASLTQYAQVGVADMTATEENTSATLPDGGVASSMEKSEETVEVIEEKKELTRNYNRADFPDLTIDFEALKAINPSCVAWLSVSGADINHPVVQCGDNEFYLHHTFEQKKNSSGCVFMDYEVNADLTSWNTFIYGHNMKNGTMFGHLKNFINNKTIYEKDPYIYIFRPEGIYRYEIFSYYLDSVDSKMYYTCDNFKEYRAYLREATAKSVRECKAKATPDENIVTLVTCSGTGANKQRFFVHGVFVDRYLY